MKNIKNELIATRPWLQRIINKEGCSIVVGADLDGYLSALLLTQHGCIVEGVYNNRQLALKQGTYGKDHIFIDFDVARQNVISVGHHITSLSQKNNLSNLYHPQGLQLNEIYDVYRKDKDAKKSFSYKYPLSTVLYLMYLLDYDLMEMNKWQRFLIFQADGVLNNNSRYPHSIQHWIDEVFGDFLTLPIKSINCEELRHLTIKYREMRRQCIPNKSNGQGKGTEKIKVIETQNNLLSFPQAKFIQEIGKQLGWFYVEDQWNCLANMELFKFDSDTFSQDTPREPGFGSVKKFNELKSNPETLISAIISDTTGKISYTYSNEETIAAAFG
jgi:hypothetical protein